MDYASSTPLTREVRRAMRRALSAYGNPSAPHEEGRRAKKLIEDARAAIARALTVRPETVYFTGSGTESNGMAIFGFIEALVERGATYSDLHIVVSEFEHPSVLEPIAYFIKKGVAVSYVRPTEDGIITPEAVHAEIKPETVFVSVVSVQSELGQIQPLKDISRIVEKIQGARTQKNQHRVPECPLPILHTDASQGLMYVDVSPERLGVDMASYDAQKIGGPKGVGVLYKHSRVPLVPLIRGGSQERKLRAGTENVVGIVGMAVAFVGAEQGRKERSARVSAVREYMRALLQKIVPDVEVNGGMKHRIANNLHVSVPASDGDYLAVLMDREGVSVSPRSACIASGTSSKAVSLLGKSEEAARGTLRFTFSPHVSKRDVRRAVRALARARRIIDTKK